MFINHFTLKVVTAFMLILLVSSCSDSVTVKDELHHVELQSVVLDVYKSPSCGCCEKWINHVNVNGFQSKVHSNNDFAVIKDEKGIAPRYRSCHTAISKEGYIFEGHIPAKYIQQFLNETHSKEALGLSVPAMPMGSPGMEVADKFQPYQILLLKLDGSYETYASIQSSKQQF